MSSLLVADPDVQYVEVVARAAARLGLRLIVAESGLEALERYRSEQPLVVVANRHLPVLDGAQLCAKIRATPLGAITALILTGDLLRDRGREIRDRLRLSDVLEKPFACDDVLRALAPFGPVEDEPSAPATAPNANAAEVSKVAPAQLLTEAVGHQRGGELVWRRGDLRKSIFIHQNRVIAGTSNGRSDLLHAWLGRDPQLPPETRSRLAALAASVAGCTGWEHDLEARGAFPGSELLASLDRWLLRLTVDILRAEDGTIEFVAGAATATSVVGIDVHSCLFFALRNCAGQSFEALLPRPSTRLERCHGGDDSHLTHVEQQFLALADGRRTIGDVLALGRLIQQDVRPFLYGVLTLGLATTVSRTTLDKPSLTPVDELARRGDIGEVNVGVPLAMLTAAHVTGILQLHSSDDQTSIHLSNGEFVFARTTRQEFRLGTILLQSGKIADDDHARALALQAGQPDRKLGSILLAIGALSLQELHDGLCCQLRLILHNLFTWEDGDWVFIEGRLPTSDMVSLDCSRETLLLDCFREMPASLASRYLPDRNAFVLCTWDSARIASEIALRPAEQRLLGLTTTPKRLSEIVTEPSLAPVVVGLLALGCLAASAHAPVTHPAELQAPNRGAEHATESAIPALDERGPWFFKCQELGARVAELEAENHKLRELLELERTVALG